MHRLCISTILVIIFSQQISAQVATIKGAVKAVDDSTAVEYASAVLPELERIGTCNKKGEFSLLNIPYGNYNLKISGLGYEIYTVKLQIDSNTIDLGDIFIKLQDYALKEVIVEGDVVMVTQDGDTTIYNAAAFAIRPEDNADDLLSKMPGVIKDGSNVKIQGETLTKVYLDRREFLGDTQTSLKNIPAEAIDNIQVYDEASEQARFAGIKDKDAKRVININTKNPKDDKAIYNFYGGGGSSLESNHQGLYKTGGNYMFIKPSGRLTVLGGVNNLNLQDVDQGENTDAGRLFSVTGGKPATSGTPGRVISTGMNISQDFKKFITTGSYTFSNNKIESVNNGKISYFPVEGQFDSKEEESRSSNISRGNNHSGSIILRSLPSLKKHSYNFILGLSSNDNSSRNNRFQSVTMDNNPVSRSTNITNSNSSNLAIRSNGMWGYKISDGRTLRLTSTFNKTKKKSYSDPTQSKLEYYDLLTSAWTTSTQNTSDRLRDESGDSDNFSATLYYTEPISKTSKLTVSAMTSYMSSQQLKEVFEYNPITEDYTVMDVTLSGDYKDVRNTQQANLAYDYSKSDGEISFAVGSDISKETQKLNSILPQERDYEMDYFIFSPSFTFNYRISKTARIGIRYSGRTLTPKAQDLIQEIDDYSPTNIRIGNPDLKKGFYNNVSISFSNSKTDKKKRSSTYNLQLGFNNNRNITGYQFETMPVNRDTILYFYPDMTEGYIPQRGATISRPVNLSESYSMNIRGSYGMNLPKMKTNINAGVDYQFSHHPIMHNQKLNYANTNKISANIQANSRISRDFDFNVRYNTLYTRVTNTSRDKANNSYISHNVNFSAYYKFWKDISISPFFNLNHKKNLSGNGYSQTDMILNISLGKKFLRSKNATATVSCYNLLNQSENMGYTVSEDRIVEYQYNTFGRYILFSLSYNFNSMRLSLF